MRIQNHSRRDRRFRYVLAFGCKELPNRLGRRTRLFLDRIRVYGDEAVLDLLIDVSAYSGLIKSGILYRISFGPGSPQSNALEIYPSQ
jgi:hypothetical protein